MRIETERLILRPWKDDDAENLYFYARDPEVGPAAGWPPHKNVEESRKVIRNVLSASECYAICIKEQDAPIGAVELILNGASDLAEHDDECELGYWLGKPFWGKGYMPEAAGALLRRGFTELGMKRIWCGYFEGNTKSKRVQEKLGFRFHHRTDKAEVPALGEIRVGYANLLTRAKWQKGAGYEIICLKNKPELICKAAAWFSKKWDIPESMYAESMEASVSGRVPAWYLCLDGDRIVGGLGLIENDFHNRKDLTPNVCAVFTEPAYRNQGIAGRLLETVCHDTADEGIRTLYLLTDHIGFYERYGWKYLCQATSNGEEKPSRMYIHEEE